MDLERTSDPTSYAAQWLPIDIVLTSDHRLVRLNVAGELDGSTADQLLGAVAHLLSGPTPGLVELNLAGLDFVDSAGIRCLLNCRTAVETAGSRLVLVEPSAQIVRVLDITGLLDLFGLSQGTGTQGSRPLHSGMRRGQPLSDLLEESAMLRRTAQQARARAEAARGYGWTGATA